MPRSQWLCLPAPVFAVLALAPSLFSQTYSSCYDYDVNYGPVLQSSNGAVEHTGALPSNHSGSANFTGSCQYTYQTGTSVCGVSCYATSTGNAAEVGHIVIGRVHDPAHDTTDGVGQSNGPQVSCGGQVATATRSCPIISGCDLSVSINAGAGGIGGSVTYTATPLWKHNFAYSLTCAAHSTKGGGTCSPAYPAPYLPPNVGAAYVWDYATCSWIEEPCSQAGCSSPIVIDTEGTGFHLTSAAEGVRFDFYGTGKPVQIAWTAKGSSNGWLALPRNGVVSSAQDLFGNLTPQEIVKDHPANGFRALAVYDQPDHGGDGNGTIDAHDAIWEKLRVWIDRNHDGISQPGELHSLEAVGVEKISLHYQASPMVDRYGNQFRYKGWLTPVNDDDVGRVIYDVFLETEK